MKFLLRLQIAISIVALSGGSLRAEEQPLPAFTSPPAKYVSRYDDELLVGDRDKKNLTFWFLITDSNYHGCSMAGRAQAWDKEHYEYVEEDCKITLIVVGNAVVLSDQNGQCQPRHCGSRAYIDGTVFFRKAR